jgi:hypothetical protein
MEKFAVKREKSKSKHNAAKTENPSKPRRTNRKINILKNRFRNFSRYHLNGNFG